MNSIAIIITVKVHYTACEGMDCFFNFNVFLISWIHHFLLPFLPQQAVSRLRTNLYQLYVYWKYSYKISTWHAELFKENLWIRTIRTGSFVVSQKIKTNPYEKYENAWLKDYVFLRKNPGICRRVVGEEYKLIKIKVCIWRYFLNFETNVRMMGVRMLAGSYFLERRDRNISSA